MTRCVSLTSWVLQNPRTRIGPLFLPPHSFTYKGGAHHRSERSICVANRWKLDAHQPRGRWGERAPYRAWLLHTKRDLLQRQTRPAKQLHTAPRSQMGWRLRTPEIASRRAKLWARRRPEETCMPCSRACLTFSTSRAFCGRCSECVLYRLCSL